MRYNNIPGTQLCVSEMALGTWVFGGNEWGNVSDDESIRAIHAAIARGVNFVDTAPIYGNGRSEEVLGKALRTIRDKVVIATKCGLQVKSGSPIPVVNLSAGFIRSEVEGSLKRLRVDAIDLYQCHWPDTRTPVQETFGEMQRLVKDGKIRYVGVSNFDEKLLAQVLEIMPVVTDQIRYSVLDGSRVDGFLSFCRRNKVGVLSYGSLGGGVLTGKYAAPPNISKSDVRGFFYKYYKGQSWEETQKTVSVLRSISARYGVRPQGTAVRWVLSHEGVVSCIVGARTEHQVHDNIDSLDFRLDQKDIDTIGGIGVKKE